MLNGERMAQQQTQKTHLLQAVLLFGILLSILAAGLPQSVWGARQPAGIVISDFHTNKARYNPEEKVNFAAEVANHEKESFRGSAVLLAEHLNRVVFRDVKSLNLRAGQSARITFAWTPPAKDYQGYLVELEVLDGKRRVARATTAVDVSSDWKKFPRYGYVAHYGKEINTASWISDLNRFHIDGIQFYDVVHKQNVPLAGTVKHPLNEWRDIGNRRIYRSTVMGFIDNAHRRNMMAMVYDPAYAAYADSISDGSGVKLQWAVWPHKSGPRTVKTIKSIPMPRGFATPRLLYMNITCSGWRNYLFARMKQFFEVFPFDGWHIDTYGDPGAYAYNRSYVNFYRAFPSFVDAARAYLHKRMVLNTVSGGGEDGMARSRADFVYSELWPPDHPTYESILQAADQIHAVNPEKAIVFAAYLHDPLATRLSNAHSKRRVYFDTTSVLLADATIFSAGASHIELGDDGRMLSGPYFPDDQIIKISTSLRHKLYSYYNFLVAYENFLRDDARPEACRLSIQGIPQSTDGKAGTVWTICRRERDYDVINLINLTGLHNTRWRDDYDKRRAAPLLHGVRVKLVETGTARFAGWASPDVDGGQYHRLKVLKPHGNSSSFELVIPSLKYWDVIFVKHGASD